MRRHDRQPCHKALEQKMGSFEEYREAHPSADISKLTVKHLPAQYKDMFRIMPGSIIFRWDPTRLLWGENYVTVD